MRLIFYFFCIFFIAVATAQEEDLLKELEKEIQQKQQKEKVRSTFKSSRIITAHSVESPAKGVLDFRISHRFGAINSGAYNFFGLDQSFIRLALEYGITDKMAAGVGRSSEGKTIDGFFKWKILQQDYDKKPCSVVFFSSFDISTLAWKNPTRKNYFSSRISYNHQLLVARKFNERLSWQIMPTLTHKNLVELEKDKNDIFSIGTGGRVKITKRTSINVEYFYVFPHQIYSYYYNPHCIAIGVDIETGGHVFQLQLTNATGMIERLFITQTTDSFFHGGIHFGFNISRVFVLRRKKE